MTAVPPNFRYDICALHGTDCRQSYTTFLVTVESPSDTTLEPFAPLLQDAFHVLFIRIRTQKLICFFPSSL